ncbi:MAG: Hsp70 family protein [bacterium]
MVSVHVLRASASWPEDSRSLARFDLVGIPPAPRGVPQIEVGFEIDADGILHVTAKDRGTGREQRIQVRPASGLNEAQIDRMIQGG